jgi:hypothetical protein
MIIYFQVVAETEHHFFQIQLKLQYVCSDGDNSVAVHIAKNILQIFICTSIIEFPRSDVHSNKVNYSRVVNDH